MKKLFLSLILTLSLIFGFNSVKSAELTGKMTDSKAEYGISGYGASCYIYISVYENGGWWIYVYTEDGIFVEKYEDL